MTDLTFGTAEARPGTKTQFDANRGLLVLYAVVFAALVAGAASVVLSRGTSADMEGPLVLLLRFMAGMKALIALAAVGLAHWRLRAPTSAGLTLGYIAALGLMIVAPGLIFSLAHIALGAALFHVGLLLFLFLAWRDEGVSLPSRLSTATPHR